MADMGMLIALTVLIFAYYAECYYHPYFNAVQLTAICRLVRIPIFPRPHYYNIVNCSDTNPCYNGGTCIKQSFREDFFCICPSSHYGAQCQLQFPDTTITFPEETTAETPPSETTTTETTTTETTTTETTTETTTITTPEITSTTTETTTSTATPPPGCEYIYDKSGIILSPNYPENYDSDLYLCYIIYGPPSTASFIFHVNDIEMEQGPPDCYYDRVRIFDGPNKDFPIVATLCGKGPFADTKSTGSVVFIRFVTDHTNNYRGFNISFASKLVVP